MRLNDKCPSMHTHEQRDNLNFEKSSITQHDYARQSLFRGKRAEPRVLYMYEEVLHILNGQMYMLAETRPAHWVIVLHLGLEGCLQPRELWFVDIFILTHRPSSRGWAPECPSGSIL